MHCTPFGLKAVLLIAQLRHFAKSTVVSLGLIALSGILPYMLIKGIMNALYPGYNVKKIKEIEIPVIVVISFIYIVGQWETGLVYIYQIIMVSVSCIISILSFVPKTVGCKDG